MAGERIEGRWHSLAQLGIVCRNYLGTVEIANL